MSHKQHMPQMPKPNKLDEVDSTLASISPTLVAASAAPSLEEVELAASSNPAVQDESPSEVKPEIENLGEKNHSNIVSPTAPKKGFEVRAKQIGFYNQHRIVENEVFFISNWEKLGDWMALTDPDLEKRHLLEIKERKAKK